MTSRPLSRVAVLGFHHLDDDLDDYTSLHRDTFRCLIKELSDRYRFVTMAQVATGLVQDDDNRSPLVLTFDDAYASILAPVLEGLSQFGARGTVYVIAEHVGGPNVWNRKCSYWTRHLRADELHELAAAGIEIGSHTMEHHNLTRLPADLLSRELRDSRARLEDTFGTVRTLAYPYGFHNDLVRREAARHYDLALTTTTKPGGTDLIADRYALRRFMVTRSMSVEQILQGVNTLWGQP